jgi:hypothetical protein
MKLKLSKLEFNALYHLFTEYVLNNQASGVTLLRKMLHTLMIDVYHKMYRVAIKSQPKYNIKLTAAEAIAFHLYWYPHIFADESFEGNLLNQIISLIDKKYSQNYAQRTL